MKIRGLLFDLYDTLAEIRKADYVQAKGKIASRAGVKEADFIEAWKKFTQPSARGEIKSVSERIMLSLADLGININSTLAEDLAQIEIDLQEKQVYLLSDCEHTRQTKNKLENGLVTNTSSVSQHVLSLLGIKKYFDCEIYSYQIGILKPDVTIYNLAASKLGLKNREIIFVGDGNDQELDGAKQAGMLAVKVGKGRDDLVKGRQSKEFDYEIQTLPELLTIVETLNSQD
jgi:putative hydrolase of the HAD superfamily